MGHSLAAAEFKFSTWIYKIAHNCAVDHLRRNAGRERSLLGGLEGDQYELPIESGNLSPEQESERRERRLKSSLWSARYRPRIVS